MSHHLSKKSILQKTAQISMLTFLSRMLGIVRELLMVRFLGVGAVSDAFIAAFKLPNFFRQIFAEGALNASFVPAIVKTVRDGNRQEANGLMTISFLFFEGIVLLIYAFVLLKTEWVFILLAPGFSAEQLSYAVPFLRILFSFIFFISSSALLAGALNSVNHFFIPAFGTPLWNMVYIATLLLCLSYHLSAVYLCVGIIVGAAVLFGAHLITFFMYNFTFGAIDTAAIAAFRSVLSKFLPCLFGVSVVEFNFFVSTSIASYLPKGDITLLNYGLRFMNIPLGMFAVALVSVMLAHFSRLVLYAPRRLNFYLLEVAKFITWAILPVMIFMIFVSHEFFALLLSTKATPEQVLKGSWLFTLYCNGLLFLCLNKILMSMFFALKDTWSTTIAAAVCASINVVLDLISLKYFGAYGIASSNTFSAFAMSIVALFFLYKRHNIRFYIGLYAQFFMRYFVQVVLASALFYAGFRGFLLWWAAPLHGLIYWLVVGLLAIACMSLIFVTRTLFGIKVYFLRK